MKHLLAFIAIVAVAPATISVTPIGVRPTNYEIMRSTAESHGFTIDQMERLWMIESRRDDSAVGRHGEVGRGQIMLSTARIYDPRATKSKLHDSLYNMRLSLAYLQDLLRLMNGDHALAFAAYNRGPGRVLADLKNKRNPVNRYAHFVAGE